MQATALLKKQHREVLALFKRAIKTEDPKAAKALVEETASHLRVHSQIEEEIFYPAVRGTEAAKADDMILEALEEHHVVDLVLDELPTVNPAAESYRAKVTVLKELVEHHAQEEEEEMFPFAEKNLGQETLAELGKEMQARVEQLQLEVQEEPRSRSAF